MAALIAAGGACAGASGRPGDAAAAPVSTSRADDADVLSDAPPCAGAGVQLAVDQPAWNSSCATDYASCRARLPTHVTNCTGRPVLVRSVDWLVRSGDGATWWPRFELTPVQPLVVPPGRRGGLHWPVVRDTEDTIQLRASVAAGDETTLVESEPFVLANAARDVEKERCLRSGGRWEALDPTDRLGCRQRSGDGGKTCRDGEECEGACLFERYEVVSSPGVRPVGRPVGRCSEFRTDPGCIRYVPRGASREAPVPISFPVPQRCI